MGAKASTLLSRTRAASLLGDDTGQVAEFLDEAPRRGDQERAKQRDGAGHGVAMEAFCILDRAGCGPLSLVAAAELDDSTP